MEVNWMQTYTGKRVNPTHLKPEDIDILDIAHHLSLICRFGGASKYHYSVAEHSIRVADILPPNLSLAGLLHDAEEAYLGDHVRGLKSQLPELSRIGNNARNIIYYRFQVYHENLEAIEKADNIMLATEAKYIINGSLDGWYLPEQPINEREYPWVRDFNYPKISQMIEGLFIGHFNSLMEAK